MSLEIGELNMKTDISGSYTAQIKDLGSISNLIDINSNVPMNLNAGTIISFRHPVNILNNSINGCTLIHSTGGNNLNFNTSIANIKFIIGTNEYINITTDNISITTIPNLSSSSIPTNVATNFINWTNFTSFTPFTPVLKTSAVEATGYTARGGYYLRVGNMVFFNLYLKLNSIAVFTTPTATVLIDLPVTYATSSGIQVFQVGQYDGMATVSPNGVSQLQCFIGTGVGSVMVFHYKYLPTSSSWTSLSIENITANFGVQLGGMYYLF